MADSDKLEDFKDLRKAVKGLRHRMDSLEDRIMMEQLQDLAIEDEIDVLKELVGHSEDDIRQKIRLLQELEEKNTDQRLDEKMRYLYTRIKELEGTQEEEDVKGKIDELENRIQHLSNQVSEAKSSKDGRDLDDVYDKLYLLRDKVKELQTGTGTDAESADTSTEQIHEQIQDEVEQTLSDELEPFKNTFKQKLKEMDERHGRKVQSELEEVNTQLSQLEEEFDQKLESVEPQDTDELKAEIADINTRLDEQLEALEYSIDDIETRLDTELHSLRTAIDDMEDSDTEVSPSEISEQVEALRDEFTQKLEKMDERHAETVKTEIDGINTRLDEQVEALEYSIDDIETRLERGATSSDQPVETAWREEMEDQVKRIKHQLSEISTADLHDFIEAQVDALKDELKTGELETGGTVTSLPDEVSEKLDDIEKTVEENEKAIEYSLEKQEEDISHLKDVLREAPDVTSDDAYEELRGSIQELEARLSQLKKDVEDGDLVDEVRETIEKELEDWESVRTQVGELQEWIDTEASELVDRVESLEEQSPAEVSDELERVTEDISNVQESMMSLSDIVERNADHRKKANERLDTLQNALTRLQNSIGSDMAEDELLEALEYSSDALENRIEELLVRIEHLREDLDGQDNRIDALSESQNLFESEIGRIIHGQKELNARFEEEDEKVNRKIDMLLEALEEGLDQKQEKGAGITGVQEEVSDSVGIREEHVAKQQRAVDHVEVHESPRPSRESHEHMKTLAQNVLKNEKQLRRVREEIDYLAGQIDELSDDLSQDSSQQPTIIE